MPYDRSPPKPRRCADLHGQIPGPTLAFHELRQAPHNRKTEPGPTKAPGDRAVSLCEGLEKTGPLLGPEPDPGVADRQHHARTPVAERRSATAYPHPAAVGNLQRITQ